MQDGPVWGQWQPGPGVTVDSWLCFGPPGWHMRVHRLATDALLHVAESGFAVDCASERTNSPDVLFEGGQGRGFVRTPAAVSGIKDELGVRAAELVRAAPNTNLLCPMTVFSRLTGTVPAGVSLLATAVFASPDPDAIAEPAELPMLLRRLLERLQLSETVSLRTPS